MKLKRVYRVPTNDAARLSASEEPDREAVEELELFRRVYHFGGPTFILSVIIPLFWFCVNVLIHLIPVHSCSTNVYE